MRNTNVEWKAIELEVDEAFFFLEGFALDLDQAQWNVKDEIYI